MSLTASRSTQSRGLPIALLTIEIIALINPPIIISAQPSSINPGKHTRQQPKPARSLGNEGQRSWKRGPSEARLANGSRKTYALADLRDLPNVIAVMGQPAQQIADTVGPRLQLF